MNAKLLRVAWFSILLGIAMEILLLVAAAGFGQPPVLKPVLADLVQKVSWSLFVCVGLAFGTVISEKSPPVMGLAGFVSAPVAFNLARMLHKGSLQALSVTLPAAAGPSSFLLALIKAGEYGWLGVATGWLSKRAKGPGICALVGLFTGLIFGGITLWLVANSAAHPLAASDWATRGINEVLFPVGCSLVLYASGALKR